MADYVRLAMGAGNLTRRRGEKRKENRKNRKKGREAEATMGVPDLFLEITSYMYDVGAGQELLVETIVKLPRPTYLGI